MTDNDRVHVLFSFAMYARMYRMPQSWSDTGAREVARNGIVLEYRMVCKYSNIARDTLDIGSSYVANLTTKFLAIFDTTQNVRAKISVRKATSFPSSSGGIMAYRVEMDDYANSCGEGVFPRLKAIKSELQA
ncbi:uncharacterized protein LOC125947104 [Dermacentor silvarum]|uniref:uncharacterized protein LOC125947104 n=1 Tax=Dermacentor silvarum TaxID=543639 RepID=UPI002101AC25|nr:uncharacterized protein LOC125947104 [Dermacentor silvarum]